MTEARALNLIIYVHGVFNNVNCVDMSPIFVGSHGHYWFHIFHVAISTSHFVQSVA